MLYCLCVKNVASLRDLKLIDKKIDIDFDHYKEISLEQREEYKGRGICVTLSDGPNNRKNPIEIGETIVSEINNIEECNKYFDKVEFVRPGFINIIVSDEFISNDPEDILFRIFGKIDVETVWCFEKLLNYIFRNIIFKKGKEQWIFLKA